MWYPVMMNPDKDLDTVIEMEKVSFPQPWSADDFCYLLDTPKNVGIVAKNKEGKIGGYMFYSIKDDKYILRNIVAFPRKQGIGSILLNKLIDKLNSSRRPKVKLIVSEQNLKAHLFFQKHGFLASKVKRGYYKIDKSYYDGYVFEYDVRRQIDAVA